MENLNHSKTHVLLVGSSVFTGGKGIDPIPNVEVNLSKLKEALQDTSIIGIPASNIEESRNEASLAIQRKISRLAQAASDNDSTLILYLSGHGMLSLKNDDLYYVTSETDEQYLEIDAVSMEKVKGIINESSARRKILILDCCHSGAFSGKMGTDQSAIQATINNFEGTYVIMSSSANKSSRFPVNKPQEPTYFTGKLLDILENGIDIDEEYCTWSLIYDNIKKDFVKRNLPEPQQSSWNNGDQLLLSKNKKYNQRQIEMQEAWQKTKGENTEISYDDFIYKYPKSIYLSEAKKLRLGFARVPVVQIEQPIETIEIKDFAIVSGSIKIFGSFHLPQYLAKGLITYPFHYLLSLRTFSGLTKIRSSLFANNDYGYFRSIRRRGSKISRNIIFVLFRQLFYSYLYINSIYLFFTWFFPKMLHSNILLTNIIEVLINFNILLSFTSLGSRLVISVLALLSFRFVRNLVFEILKFSYKIFARLTFTSKYEVFNQYLSIIKNGIYVAQLGIFRKLTSYYDDNASFMVCTLDMDYIRAGKTRTPFLKQVAELKYLSSDIRKGRIILPFLSIDPRRIKTDKDFLRFIIRDRVILDDCYVKNLFEKNGFKGFCINPATGFYPFDEHLLLLYKYAQENNIPVYADTAQDILYYRGKKKVEWDLHPVFTEVVNNEPLPLYLPGSNPIDVARNFSHPLNFLCILDEKNLRNVIHSSSMPELKVAFGYTDENTMLLHNLSNLKICFSRFGVDKDWGHSNDIGKNTTYAIEARRNPNIGIRFFQNSSGQNVSSKLKKIWFEADWHTIITSLMLQYKNVYSDTAFMATEEDRGNLVVSAMKNPILASKVIFSSGQSILAEGRNEFTVIDELERCLSSKMFKMICNSNPEKFLERYK